MSNFSPDVQGQVEALGYLLARIVLEYFEDETHRAEFEAWYLEKYGKPYVWKSIDNKNSEGGN